jgi:hypothetical protein
MIASTPRVLNSPTNAFTVSASSSNSSPAALEGDMMSGVPFKVSPMKATGMPSNSLIS